MTAYISTGITVSFGTLSAELLDLTTTGESADTVDVTHQTSTSQWREFLAGFKDGGEVTWTLHCGGTVPAVGGDADTLGVTLPSGAGTLSVSAILSKRKALNAPLGDKIVEEITFKCTGVPTWS